MIHRASISTLLIVVLTALIAGTVVCARRTAGAEPSQAQKKAKPAVKCSEALRKFMREKLTACLPIMASRSLVWSLAVATKTRAPQLRFHRE